MFREDWFEVTEINDHLYLIRERLDLVDDKFRTKFTNIYLLVGETQCILFDTGSGIMPIWPVVQKIVLDKHLVVINSHNHFDHIGGNSEFKEVQIHRFDFKPLMQPVDIGFLSPNNEFVKQILRDKQYQIVSAQTHIPLLGDELFNLGKITVKVIHTPGHTSGSVCLLTNLGELFTGDTIHYGAVYFPSEERMGNYLASIDELMTISQEAKVSLIYPAHEDTPIGVDELGTLRQHIINRRKYSKSYDELLDAWIVEKNHYTLIFPSEK